MSFVAGCDKGGVPPASETVVRTNVVTVTREVTVTNLVEKTVTVTNVVVEKREPARILSARKTAPYFLAAKSFDAAQLRKLAADSAARVIECREGAVATVEASDRAAKLLSEAVDVFPYSADSKVSSDVGEQVRILPLSTIDAAVVAEAVRSLGGEIVQVVTVGAPVVRAKMSYSTIRKLAERGDVRRIERDGK